MFATRRRAEQPSLASAARDARARPRPQPHVATGTHPLVAPPADDALAGMLARAVVQRSTRPLPGALRRGIEALGGVELSGVRVHYDSPIPAQIGARAFASGSDIHLGPGQQRHLAHEAWHVVQQHHGRVRATHRIGETAVNADPALEREAEAMSAAPLDAIRSADAMPAGTRTVATGVNETVVQGLFDWAIDASHNRRKVGVEITEATVDNTPTPNRLYTATPTAVWTGLNPLQQAAAWTNTVILRDHHGNRAQWLVAPLAAMTGGGAPRFTLGGSKSHWMSWGTVRFTEDHGEVEWIISHPATPQGVTYYRDRLAEVQTSRAELRRVLGALPAPHQFVLSRTNDAAAGNAFAITLGNTNAASSQITLESTDTAVSKKGLMEGLSAGLVTRGRTVLADADADVVAAIQTAAARTPLAGVDMELVLAYIFGDLAHKVATLAPGAGVAWTNAAANFKDWRMLFPKSTPSQILAQANTGALTANQIRTAIRADRANIINDVLELFASKLHARQVAPRWQPAHFTALTDPANVVFTALHTGVLPAGPPPGGGLPGLTAALATFVDQNVAGFMTTEFRNVVNALAGGPAHVVRSSGFAHHAVGTTGFAFEDRAEVQTNFPGLATTYERIKLLVDRY